VVNEDLPKTITAILRWRMKQQESHLFAGGNGQHALAGVSVRDIIADRIFGLLSVVQGDEFDGTAAQPFSSAYCMARAAPETAVKTAQIVPPAGSQ
jgi:hypothetical protein